MTKITVIHGPNLNLLGQREPLLYGKTMLSEIDNTLKSIVKKHGTACSIECCQFNAEHEIIAKIQSADKEQISFFIINAGAFTHTSIAIRDAFLAVQIPFIEVHLTNPLARESFRHQSYLSDLALGIVQGLGAFGYEAALKAALLYLQNKS